MKNNRIILVMFWMLAGTQLGWAQFTQDIIGHEIANIRINTDKANQSKVFWHQGSWWGVFRNVNSADWFLYQYHDETWQQVMALAVSGEDSPDAHVDADRNKVYISFSLRKRVARLTWSNGSFSMDSGFPVAVDLDADSNDPTVITRAADGDLFLFFARVGTLYGLHSSNDGATWTNRFQIRSSINSALTDAISFTQSGQNYVGLFVGQGSGDLTYRFFRLADNQNPTSTSNWTEESLPSIGSADDHVSMVKDFENNLYAVVKLGNGSSGQTFSLFHRSNGGNWNSYPIHTEFPGNSTRPTVTVDESANKLYIFATVGNYIRYATLDLDDLREIDHTDWQVILKNHTDVFNDPSVSYQPHTGGGEIMVLASNSTSSRAWFNLLSLDYEPASSLLISEVNSAESVSGSASYVEIFNYSRNTINLSGYSLQYFDDGDTSPSSTRSLSGSIPPLGYVVVARSGSAFQSAYGFSADFTASGFPFDGGEDAIRLVNGSTVIDEFNNGANKKLDWSEGQNFQRSNYPIDGSNLFFAYRNGDVSDESPAENNPLPLFKNNRLVTGIDERYNNTAVNPQLISLYPAYPNPFNPQTTIAFELTETAPVRVDVYTIDGRLVRRLHGGLLSSGEHHFQWHGDDNGNVPVASGVYVVQVHTPIQRQSQKVMLVR